MKKIQKIQVHSAAKIGAAIGLLIGLILGSLYSIGGLIYDLFATGINHGTWLAFGALWGMPLMGAGLGLLIGFIGALCYNLAAKYTGGIEIES